MGNFEQNKLKDELQHIISGAGKNSQRDLIQAAANYLNKGKRTGSKIGTTKSSKSEETKRLEGFIELHNLWYEKIDEETYIVEGGEQRVYLDSGHKHVVKINDSIYYSFWQDYFHSLLIHNHLFPDTAYELVGFKKASNQLYAVVKQPFVESTEPIDLEKVKEFLNKQGFLNNKNNDYYNPELGLILEDLHDENVLSSNGVPFFIDTVFYLTDKFFD